MSREGLKNRTGWVLAGTSEAGAGGPVRDAHGQLVVTWARGASSVRYRQDPGGGKERRKGLEAVVADSVVLVDGGVAVSERNRFELEGGRVAEIVLVEESDGKGLEEKRVYLTVVK